MDEQQLSGTALAYIGDAVFEVYVRKKLLSEGLTRPKDLNRASLCFVKATSQSEAIGRILPLLTDEESEVFKRGRNASGLSAPKSADTASYRRATGLEALFGWLYLRGNEARAKELFDKAFEKETEGNL